MKNLCLLSFMSLMVVACSTAPSILPDKEEVKVSRKAPSEKCQDLGKFLGSGPDKKSALDDLLEEVANKGGDYLQVLEYSALGSRVSGRAFKCYE